MRKCSVFIVDDDEDDRYMIKRYLRKCKLVGTVREFEDGKYALEYIETICGKSNKTATSFAIVLLDINMPLVGGFEFLETLKKFEENQGLAVSIIVMSSSKTEADIKKSLSYSYVKDFVFKGDITDEFLCENIRNLGH